MKKMMIPLLVFLITNLSSAIGLRLGVEGNMAKPTASILLGQYNQTFDQTGYGLTACGMIDIVFLKITANVGFINFPQQTLSCCPGTSVDLNIKAVPILAGLRWELGLPVGPKFFFGFQAGVHQLTFEYEGTAVNQKLVSNSESESRFSFAPVIGMRLSSLEASLLYMVIEDFNYVGLRVGYTFGFGL